MMKNSLLFAFAGALLFLAACNSLDQEVVDSLQTSLTKVQDNQTAIETGAQNLANLREQMEKAPDGLRSSVKFGYGALLARVDAISQGYASLETARAELQKKLEAAMADYTDGKVDKEAALKEQKAVQEFIAGAQVRLDQMAPMFDELSAEYAKMSATWESLPEAERQALSAPQPEAAAPGSLQQGPLVPGNVRPQTSNSLVKPQGSGRE